MGTISLTLPVASTVANAGMIAGDFTTIQTVINGNIDNNNFGAGKIFDPTKLTQNAAATGQVLNWNGSNWAPAGSMIQLSDTTLGADTASFDITSISGAYSALRAVLYVRDDSAGTTIGALQLRANNDSGANYDYQLLTGNAATASGAEQFAATSMQVGDCVNGGAGANLFSAVTVDIPHYAGAANNKTVLGSSAAKWGTTTGKMEVRQAVAFWRSNAAITRLTFLPGGASNFKIGSRCTLYGLY